MHIYEYSSCDKCGKSYKGKFKMQRGGKVTCYDCKYPEKFQELQWEAVQATEEHVLSEIVKDLLKKDLKRIFVPLSERGVDELQSLRDKDGNIIPEKLYFQGNDIDFVIEAHKKAYISLEYMESGKNEYKEIASTVYNKYLSLREKKMSKEEKEEYENEMNSYTFRKVEQEVEHL